MYFLTISGEGQTADLLFLLVCLPELKGFLLGKLDYYCVCVGCFELVKKYQPENNNRFLNKTGLCVFAIFVFLFFCFPVFLDVSPTRHRDLDIRGGPKQK